MTMRKILLAAMAGPLALVITPAMAEPRQVDLILHNGPVFTAEADFAVHNTVVVDGGRILAVGGADLNTAYTAEKTIDLNGRLLIPGFNDAHTHIWGNARGWIKLSDVTSIEEMQNRIRKAMEKIGPDGWVTGYGWSEDRLEEKRKPTRQDLDAVARDVPVLLTREGGHSAVANSKALAIAGITAATPQPDGGTIFIGQDGTLTGVIAERFDLVAKFIPEPNAADIAASLGDNLEAQFALGITSLTHANASITEFEIIWKTAYADTSRALPRGTVQIDPHLQNIGLKRAMAAFNGFDGVSGQGDARLKIGALKVFVDGGFTGPAAFTREPYRNDVTYFGALASPLADIEVLARAAHAKGWQLGFHAIGDAAIEETAAMFGRILKDAPRRNHRHYLNHFTVPPVPETMEQMARDGIAITQQPNFTYSLEGRYRTYLPPAKLERNNPVATPIGHGVFVAFSSDIIPIGPLVGLYAAVTRKGQSGTVYGADERIPVADAIRRYTHGGAYITFEEDLKGTITPGKVADLVVLDRNILETDPNQILEAQVDLTLLEGQIVFERTAP